MLNIKKTVENGNAQVALEGRLDTTTAPELEKELQEILEGLQTLTLDFTNLEYISSAGLRVLLAIQKMMDDKPMKVTKVNEVVQEVFDVTGFSDIITVE